MNPNDIMKHNLLVNAARLYYLHDLTHEQIAKKLNLSRVKVTRLLQEAVRQKIIEFKIQDALVDALETADELERMFNLEKVIIVPSSPDEHQTYDILGAHMADFLEKHMRDNLTLGLSWGRTLNAMVPHLKPSKKKNLNVVSVTGGLAANARQPNPYDITSSVAKKWRATPHYLLVPAIVENIQVKNLLLNEPSAKKVIQRWNNIDVCMMSIGTISRQTGVFYALEDAALQLRRTKESGGVGDIMAKPFNIHGKFLKTEFSERTITIDIEQLRKVPKILGIAIGRKKIPSILGAIRTGILSTLMTDEYCARKVIELAKGRKTKKQ